MIIIKKLDIRQLKSRRRRYVIAKYECCGTQIETTLDYANKVSSCIRCGHKTHGMSSTRLYKIWQNMKKRCYNSTDENYAYYGGRGITVCDEWKDPNIFIKWALSNGYDESLTIDRINNDGNYEPSNCRWATYQMQGMNTRRINKMNTTGYRGVTYKKDGRNRPYVARITVDYKLITIGSFYSAIHAGLAFDTYADMHNLEHTRNFPHCKEIEAK